MSASHCNIVIIAACQGPSKGCATQHRLLEFYINRGQGEEGEEMRKAKEEKVREWEKLVYSNKIIQMLF